MHVEDFINNIINPRYTENNKLLETFDDFTYEDYCKRKELWLRNFSSEWQIIGHISEEHAKLLVEDCESSFADLKKEVSHDSDYLILRSGTVNEYSIPHPNTSILNSTAICYFQSNKVVSDFKSWACNQILFTMLHQRVFLVLRTKEQLGYTAKSIPMNIASILGGLILVHSPIKDPEYLVHRINTFLDNFKLTDEKFEKYRGTEIAKLQTKIHSLNYGAEKIWNEVYDQTYIFDRKQKQIDALEGLVFEDICKHWNSMIGEGSRRINIKIVGEPHKEGDADAKELNTTWYKDNNLDLIQIDPEDIPSFMALHTLKDR